MKKILITGADGQLGSELRELSPLFSHQFEFLFATRTQFPLDDDAGMIAFFNRHSPAYCINCAAYTAVDKAETEQTIAMRINGDAVGLLATLCQQAGTQLIHISTDYVFDGTSSLPLKEDAPVNPVNFYGLTKLAGEQLIQQTDPTAIIIRTSWVYSAYGQNFVKTMLRLMRERSELKVVNDQIGAPTYAADLAKAIMGIISFAEKHPDPFRLGGVYHYCNEGETSWYEFAVEIGKLIGSKCKIAAISSAEFPTEAKRPLYSLLDNTKIQRKFNIPVIPWKESLADCLLKMQQYIS